MRQNIRGETPRWRLTIAVIASCGLLLSACSVPSEQGAGADERATSAAASTPPSITLSVTPDLSPQPDWAFDTMPPGTDVRYAVNADSSRIAVMTFEPGATLTIVQLDTATGTQEGTTTVDLLGTDSEPQLRYTGADLLVVQTGTIPGEGTTKDAPGWSSTSIASDGAIAGEATGVFPDDSFGLARNNLTLLPGDAPVAYVGDFAGSPSPDEFLKDASSDLPPLVLEFDPSTGEIASQQWVEDLPADACNEEGECTHRALPAARVGSDVVTAYHESVSGALLCDYSSLLRSAAQGGGCVSGFRTEEWTSPEIAPSGTRADQGELMAVGRNHVLGTWPADDNGLISALIEVASGEVVATLDCTPEWHTTPLGEVTISHNGKHAISGTARMSLETGDGECFNETDVASALYFANVADDGATWGYTAPDAMTGTVRIDADGAETTAENGLKPALAFTPGGLALIPIDDAPEAGYAGVAGTRQVP